MISRGASRSRPTPKIQNATEYQRKKFGGFGTYAIQYFNTGSDGALHSPSRQTGQETGEPVQGCEARLNEANKALKDYPTGWPKNQPPSESPCSLTPASRVPWLASQALIGSTRQQTDICSSGAASMARSTSIVYKKRCVAWLQWIPRSATGGPDPGELDQAPTASVFRRGGQRSHRLAQSHGAARGRWANRSKCTASRAF